MVDRAGPPHPRPEKSWTPTEQPTQAGDERTDWTGRPLREQYAERDEFCRAFLLEGRFDNRYNSMVIAAIKDGFNAGWAARKQSEYNLLVNQKKAVDKKPAVVDTLFPTIESHDDPI